jgi:hypothetical protein
LNEAVPHSTNTPLEKTVTTIGERIFDYEERTPAEVNTQIATMKNATEVVPVAEQKEIEKLLENRKIKN